MQFQPLWKTSSLRYKHCWAPTVLNNPMFSIISSNHCFMDYGISTKWSTSTTLVPRYHSCWSKYQRKMHSPFFVNLLSISTKSGILLIIIESTSLCSWSAIFSINRSSYARRVSWVVRKSIKFWWRLFSMKTYYVWIWIFRERISVSCCWYLLPNLQIKPHK